MMRYWPHISEWLGDWWTWYKPTEGELCLGLAFGVIAFLGAGVGYETLSYLAHDHSTAFVPTAYEAWVIFGAVIGATGALYSLRGQFGHRGGAGALTAIKGALGVTFLGSLIGGTLAMPVFGTMFGPFAFMMLFVTKPAVGLMWAGSLLAAHILMRGWRIERDA